MACCRHCWPTKRKLESKQGAEARRRSWRWCGGGRYRAGRGGGGSSCTPTDRRPAGAGCGGRRSRCGSGGAGRSSGTRNSSSLSRELPSVRRRQRPPSMPFLQVAPCGFFESANIVQVTDKSYYIFVGLALQIALPMKKHDQRRCSASNVGWLLYTTRTPRYACTLRQSTGKPARKGSSPVSSSRRVRTTQTLFRRSHDGSS